jgi:hypothetical protein
VNRPSPVSHRPPSVRTVGPGHIDAVARRWKVVSPTEARWFAVPHMPRARSQLVADLEELPVGTCVVLCDSWLLSRGRCRKLASQCSIVVAREYVALPTLSGALVLLQDEAGTARYLADNLLSAPPTPTMRARIQEMLIPVVGRTVSHRMRSAVFAGRVVIGTRT